MGTISGKVKVFGLVTGMILIGEVLSESKAVARLRHPVWFMTQGGKQGAQQVVPAFLPEWSNISSDIRLVKVNVLYRSAAPLAMMDLYEKARAQMLQASTGLKVATTSDMAKFAAQGVGGERARG